MKMSKFSIKKKSKEIPTEAVIAYSKGNMLEKIREGCARIPYTTS